MDDHSNLSLLDLWIVFRKSRRLVATKKNRRCPGSIGTIVVLGYLDLVGLGQISQSTVCGRRVCSRIHSDVPRIGQGAVKEWSRVISEQIVGR
jgi:hypothetical protein